MKPKKINNSSLKSKYESIYKKGAYKKFFSFDKNSIQNSLVKSIANWNKLDVLDVGCFDGKLLKELSNNYRIHKMYGYDVNEHLKKKIS